MTVAIIIGTAGLIGSESALHFGGLSLARLLEQKVELWNPDPGRTARPTEVVGYG